MKRKKKAFTLLELILTLGITLVVIATIYTFFLSNTKTMKSTEINTDLQAEAQKIQSEFLKYGTEANGVYSINGIEVKDDNMIYTGVLDGNGKLDVEEITFNVEENKYIYTFNSSTGELKVQKNTGEIIGLSNNIQEIKVRPLDFRSNPGGRFYKTNGIEISLVLNIKKSYTDVTIPSSVIVKFRNK